MYKDKEGDHIMYNVVIVADIKKKAIRLTTVNNYKELKELRSSLAYGLYAHRINDTDVKKALAAIAKN